MSTWLLLNLTARGNGWVWLLAAAAAAAAALRDEEDDGTVIVSLSFDIIGIQKMGKNWNKKEQK